MLNKTTQQFSVSGVDRFPKTAFTALFEAAKKERAAPIACPDGGSAEECGWDRIDRNRFGLANFTCCHIAAGPMVRIDWECHGTDCPFE
jgi:hypothetical protein